MIDYKFTVNIPEGLHARPCARIVDALEPFQPVLFMYQDKLIESLSVLELLMLKIPFGSSIIISTNAALPLEIENKLEKIFL